MESDLEPPAWWPWGLLERYKPGSWQRSGAALRNGMDTVLWGESYVGKSSHLSPGRGWAGMVEDTGTATTEQVVILQCVALKEESSHL